MSFGNSYEVWLDRGLWYWQIITASGRVFDCSRGYKQKQSAEAVLEVSRAIIEAQAKHRVQT